MPPEVDPEASEVNECIVDGELMFMMNQQAAKLSEPGIGPLHDPSPLVATKCAANLMAPSLVVLPVRGNQFDAAHFEPLAQRIGIITVVSYDALRLLPRTAAWPDGADFGDCGFRKLNFTRGALSSRTPIGRPLPSNNTIQFVPLPRFALATAGPRCSLVQSCRPAKSRPT